MKDDVAPTPELRCTIEECVRRKWARGWCSVHYSSWRRHGDPMHARRCPPAVAKPCSIEGCDDFAKALGLCEKHYQRQRRTTNPLPAGYHRPYGRKALLKQYGLTVADYEALVQKQRGRCAICKTKTPGNIGRSNSSWSVDHDHVTGQVRGLLCGRCNSGIAMLGDDPATILAAARYVQRHRQMVLSL